MFDSRQLYANIDSWPLYLSALSASHVVESFSTATDIDTRSFFDTPFLQQRCFLEVQHIYVEFMKLRSLPVVQQSNIAS